MTNVRAQTMNRRDLLVLGIAAGLWPSRGLADAPLRVEWDDLIPPGVAYSEIIGVGEIDEVNDTWNPIFDENGTKLNEALDGARIRMPGYVLPLDFTAEGISNFVLVPYVGACIHVPPPPPNQLVFVTSDIPWPSSALWDAVWVTGRMSTRLQTTEVAQTGYALVAERIEPFDW